MILNENSHLMQTAKEFSHLPFRSMPSRVSRDADERSRLLADLTRSSRVFSNFANSFPPWIIKNIVDIVLLEAASLVRSLRTLEGDFGHG
jgi:hypothetical protein